MKKRTLAAVVAVAATAGAMSATIPGAIAGGEPATPKSPRAWNTIAPGKKVYGVIGGACVAAKQGDVCAATASIFPYTRNAIGPAQFGVYSGAVENPECAGDPGAPLAAPGVVCIYLNPDEAKNVRLNGEGSFEAEAFPIFAGNYGFKLRWQANAAGSSEIYGIWVYQEPDPNAVPAEAAE